MTDRKETSAAPSPAPGAEGKFDHLRALLREMFQLDRGDLDFGLYRIMKLKSAEIASFLDHDLLPVLIFLGQRRPENRLMVGAS